MATWDIPDVRDSCSREFVVCPRNLGWQPDKTIFAHTFFLRAGQRESWCRHADQDCDHAKATIVPLCIHFELRTRQLEHGGRSEPMQQPVLSFLNLIQKDAQTMLQLRSLFECQGFAFIRFTPEHVTKVRDAMGKLEPILARGPLKNIHGRRFGGKLGFMDTDHKASITCLTGSELERFTTSCFGADQRSSKTAIVVRHLAKMLDDLLEQLVEATVSDLFGKTLLTDEGESLDIPFLQKGDGHPSFGLFDATLYKNTTTPESSIGSGTGRNCAEHYDPGLYSLWIGETQPGLKLRDGSGSWISPPSRDSNTFVLWLGQAASHANPKFLPAMHRVDKLETSTPSSPTRLSVWTELCTRNQVLDGFSDGLQMAEFASARVIEVKNAFVDGHPYRVRVENGNVSKALDTVHEVLRMPYSKVITIPICDDEGFVTGTH